MAYEKLFKIFSQKQKIKENLHNLQSEAKNILINSTKNSQNKNKIFFSTND